MLDVELGGPEDGQALFLHTGTPSGGVLYGPHVAAGAERGLRHITYARPGYGGSDRREGRTVADCADDVAAIADELGIERFFTIGWSGGAPHAMACAGLLPDRVIAATAIAAPAPIDADGLVWTDGMGQENIDEYGAAMESHETLIAFLDNMAPQLAGATGTALHEALGDLLSEVDRQALSGDYADHLAASTRAAMSNGIWGWFDDDIAFIRDWGFDLGAVERPVAIWHGEEDRFVPFGNGRWLAGTVSGARPHLLAGEGHLSLTVGSYGRILDDLVASGG